MSQASNSSSNERGWGAIRFNSSLPMRSSSAVSLRERSCARRGAPRHGSRRQFAAVYHLPGRIDRFEIEPLRRDLDGHKAAVLVTAGGEKRRIAFQVSPARLAARSRDEILHALLRFNAFVNVIVA